MLRPLPRRQSRTAALWIATLFLAPLAVRALDNSNADQEGGGHRKAGVSKPAQIWGVQSMDIQVPPVSASPSPAGDVDEDEAELGGGQAGPSNSAVPGRCGTERWKIKALNDAAATTVKPGQAQRAAIANLTSLPLPPSKLGTAQGCLAAAPHPLPQTPEYGYDPRNPQWAYDFLASNPPRGAAETKVYSLDVILVEARQEGDHDFHLVIKDPATGETMIAEVSDPNCNEAQSSPFNAALAQTRKDFGSLFGALPQIDAVNPANPPPFMPINQPITLTGVAFFDFSHHQNGLAKNCVELHPVLSIRKR